MTGGINMTFIQEAFNAAHGDAFRLPPGEYEGPLRIDRPCTVDGAGATVFCPKGPIITVSARNVTLKNLRVESTSEDSDPSSEIAITTSFPDTRLEAVEVRGKVVGIPGEPEQWELPPLIDLGKFAADSENSFLYTIPSPGSAALTMSVNGLKVTPSRLSAGKNAVLLTTDRLRHNARIYGELTVTSAVSRRIYITGSALTNAPRHTDALPPASPEISSPNPEPPSAGPARAPETSVRMLQRGQRIAASELKASGLRFILDYRRIAEGMEVDGYCFLLNESGKVSGDRDLIFFGNKQSSDLSVAAGYYEAKPMITVDLYRVAAGVKKIAVCFAVYGDDPALNFSKITAPAIRMFGGEKEYCRLDLSHLKLEKTCVALELYRHKGEWKINPVGSGYRDSLRQLCRGYGVDVE
jgi:Uncharacterized proteins involved in stress response, homologs of TerZ and putative cAMP-binding protein CABP1